nr:type II CAAX endopeptidase family protein [Tissierella sp.]
MENERLGRSRFENRTLLSEQYFKKIGYSLFGMVAAVILTQTLLSAALMFLAPWIMTSPWWIAILIGIPLYLVGFPVFLSIIRKVPNGPKGPAKKLSFMQILVFFFISMAATYLFNIVGNLINYLIAVLKGSPIANPLESMLGGSSLIPIILVVVILSPIVEEVIFRGIILDKLRGYGDKTAIMFTALTFGLLHGNLSQFFYAFVLGLIFGYIAIQTNTILYTIILHIAINLFGSVLMPALALSGNDVLVILSGGLMLAFMFVGGLLFFKNYKNIKLDSERDITQKIQGTEEIEVLEGLEETEIIEEVDKKPLYLNQGIILFYLASLFLFVSTIFAS